MRQKSTKLEEKTCYFSFYRVDIALLLKTAYLNVHCYKLTGFTLYLAENHDIGHRVMKYGLNHFQVQDLPFLKI